MCNVCGCGEGNVRIDGEPPHKHTHDHGGAHEHDHHHHHHHHSHDGHVHHYGNGPARAHAPGLSQGRMVQIEQDILSKNNEYANANRRYFKDHGILTLNFVSSPGSGKTTLLTRAIVDLKDRYRLSVVEGDQQTENDAKRIRETGVSAVQVNTGKGCHLDGHMVGHAVESLKPVDGSIVFIENVGNLVCPAGFDLGEAHKVVILSVTEGEDKPIKYPDMFHAADVMLLNKIDLLPHVDFDVARCIDYTRQVNPSIKIFEVSATSGAGMDNFYNWVSLSRQLALMDHPTLAKTAGQTGETLGA